MQSSLSVSVDSIAAEYDLRRAVEWAVVRGAAECAALDLELMPRTAIFRLCDWKRKRRQVNTHGDNAGSTPTVPA